MVKIVDRTQEEIEKKKREETIKGLVKEICGDVKISEGLIVGRSRGRNVMVLNPWANSIYTRDKRYADPAMKLATRYEALLRTWSPDVGIEVTLIEDYSED